MPLRSQELSHKWILDNKTRVDKFPKYKSKKKVKPSKNGLKQQPKLKWFINRDILPSVAETKIIEILNSLGIKYYREVSFKACRGKGNSYMRFDFYIPNLNIIIEYDGKHHENPDVQYRDSIKDAFCLRNKIKLYRLNKKHYYNLQEAITSLLPV